MRRAGDYLLPRDEREARRLELQADLLREATEALLSSLDIAAGARCLDVGCGTGDCMGMIARHAGPSAHVVGLDLDVAPARRQVERLAREGAGRFELVQGDLFGEAPPAGGPFDLVFSRYLVHHMPDPLAALGRMWQHTAPGGTLAVLDIDARGTTTHPVWPPYEEIERLVSALFRATGIDNEIGHKLPSLFEQAGVGRPDGVKVIGAVRTIAELAEFLELLLDMVRDRALQHGVASAADLARLEAELATAGAQTSTWCYRPTAVAVWRRRPA